METTVNEPTARERIEAICEELGLSISTVFVPFSKSRNAKPEKPGEKPWRSLNWLVTLHMPHGSITTDYSAGIAHCPAYKASVKALGHQNSIMRDAAITWEIEHGFPSQTGEGIGVIAARNARPLIPDTVDVIVSLVNDANALDSSSFEEWASDLGYDTDSRKAESIYRACLDIGLKLRNGIGAANLQRLREPCQEF